MRVASEPLRIRARRRDHAVSGRTWILRITPSSPAHFRTSLTFASAARRGKAVRALEICFRQLGKDVILELLDSLLRRGSALLKRFQLLLRKELDLRIVVLRRAPPVGLAPSRHGRSTSSLRAVVTYRREVGSRLLCGERVDPPGSPPRTASKGRPFRIPPLLRWPLLPRHRGLASSGVPQRNEREPHTETWFKALAMINPDQAAHTHGKVIELAGTANVCGMCGDEDRQDYTVPRSPLKARWCADCKRIQDSM
jgi:hypothetical protein